jgi:hypothetical protein
MKRYSHVGLYFLSLLFTVAALLSACKKDLTTNSAPPAITSVRLYNPSPKDTLLSTGDPKTDPSWSIKSGRYVVILGQNLQNATQISINGVPANFNPTLFAPGSAVVQIPNIQFSTVDTAKLYMLEYTTPAGSTTFSFKLGPEAPTFVAVSDVFAAPGDSVFIYGTNLVLVENFQYGGTKINSFKYNTWGTALGFLMPATTSNQQITITTKSGTVQGIIDAKPTITGVSYQNANAGDSVYVYGTYLKGIQSLTYAGTAITSFVSAKNGSSVGFVVPTLTQSGIVSVTTSFGSAATVYHVNASHTGFIGTMEWDNYGWDWNGGSLFTGTPPADWRGYDAAFEGITKNLSQFVVKTLPVMKAGEGQAWGWPPTYYLNFNPIGTWLPTANLADAPGNWALRFDVSIPKDWKGSTINVISNAGSYVARWEPWAQTGKAFKTKGWITVTLPLTEFRTVDPVNGVGKGNPLTKITDLVGVDGKAACEIYFKNYGNGATTTGFYGAFDNIRLEKVK